jgi:hypothetical protein
MGWTFREVFVDHYWTMYLLGTDRVVRPPRVETALIHASTRLPPDSLNMHDNWLGIGLNEGRVRRPVGLRSPCRLDASLTLASTTPLD